MKDLRLAFPTLVAVALLLATTLGASAGGGTLDVNPAAQGLREIVPSIVQEGQGNPSQRRSRGERGKPGTASGKVGTSRRPAASVADRTAIAGILRGLRDEGAISSRRKVVTLNDYDGMWEYLFAGVVLLAVGGLCFYFARRVDHAGHTRLRWTFGAKMVSGYCILILALTGVSIWSLFALRGVGEEIGVFAQEILPVTKAVMGIEADQLGQTDAMQRVFRFGAEKDSSFSDELDGSIDEWEGHARKADAELLRVTAWLDDLPARCEMEAEAISEAVQSLSVISGKRKRLRFLTEKVIGLIRTAQQGQVRLLEDPVVALAKELERDLEGLLSSLQDRADTAAAQVVGGERHAVTMIMIAAVVSIFLGFLCAVGYTRRISLAIQSILDVSKDVAGGDLANRVEVSGTDELSELGQALNQMVATFRDVATVCDAVVVGDYSTKVTVKGEKDQLGRAVNQMIENLGDVVGQVYVTGSQMVSACGEQALGAKNQSIATEEMTSTVSELLTSARQMAENAGNVSTRAESAANECTIGTASVESAVQGVRGVHERVDKIATHMVELGGKSQQISGVLDILTELSEQTNLLSLNASIEAAGAGDAGKRFAVVASEIRKLAERAAESTVEVRGLIDAVQKTVNATIMATEEGTKAVREGVRLTEEVDRSFGRIAEGVSSTTQSAKAIEMGSRQQASAVEQMEVAVRNVDTVAQQTAESARQVDTSAQALLDTARKLQGSGRELQGV